MLVGRDDLIADLVAAARDAASGRGSIVLLTGEAGIGKTSVARAVAHAVRDDIAVTWGAGLADGTAPPYWSWEALLALGPSDSAPGMDDAPGAPRLGQLTALRDEVRRAATEQPRVHVVEDLQWADVASVLLLAHLGISIADVPLLVVATLRTDEPRSAALGEAIEAVRRAARAVHDLPALTVADVATLVRGTGGDVDDDRVVAVHARTGGNPLFVSELLRASTADDIPTRVADVVVRRLARLPAAVADVLATASVIGPAGDTATLADAHGVAVGAAVDLLEQARATHFLDAAPAGRWQFRHQLVRDAIYATVGAGDRARRHAQVLDALSRDASVSPTTTARHALAALPLFDADRAVALAARAGELSYAQHAYEEAIEWFAVALDAAPPTTSSRWRAELLLLSGEAQRHVGDIASARQSFLRAGELTDDADLLARAALGYASPGADLGIAYRTEDADTGALLDRAITAHAGTDSATLVQLEARLAAELYFSDEPGRARELADAALARARRLGDPRALGIATAVVHDAFVVGQADLAVQLEESARLLAWANASGSVPARLTAHRARVLDLLAAGDIAGVDSEVLAFRRLAGPLRAPGYTWWLELWSAMRALLDGRHDVAEERALAAFRTGESPFPALSFMNLSFLLFFLRREQGRLAEMEDAVRDYAASHADVPALRVAHAFLLAELGRMDEARSAVATFDDAALDRLRDRNWPASWFQLARAAFLVGDRAVATALLAPSRRPSERCVQISLATVCLGATDLAAGWLHHTLGDLDAADAAYRSAAELNARIGARSWLAQARADHARLLAERGRPGDAEEAARLLDLAAAAAAEIGLATVPAATERAGTSTATATATFRRGPTTWEVAFAGRTAQVAHAKGMADLAFLLCRPGEAVSVLELAGEAEVTRGAAALDERARREIRERLHALDRDEADAEAAGDGARAALAREQRQQLAEAVARDFGLRGRSRRVDDPVERARKTVSTRIRRTIATVGRAHPELGRHLERSVDTGTWCAYRPAEPVAWQT